MDRRDGVLSPQQCIGRNDDDGLSLEPHDLSSEGRLRWGNMPRHGIQFGLRDFGKDGSKIRRRVDRFHPGQSSGGGRIDQSDICVGDRAA